MKTLEFINSRRPDLEIRASFIHQLSAYENRLYKRGQGPRTSRWTELSDNNSVIIENEELLLRNTYLNSQMAPLAEIFHAHNMIMNQNVEKNFTLVWADVAKNNKDALVIDDHPDFDLINMPDPPKVTGHRRIQASQVTSVLKGGIQNKKLKAAQAKTGLKGSNSQKQIGRVGSQDMRRSPRKVEQPKPQAPSFYPTCKELVPAHEDKKDYGTEIIVEEKRLGHNKSQSNSVNETKSKFDDIVENKRQAQTIEQKDSLLNDNSTMN